MPYSVDGGGTIRFTAHPRYAVGAPVDIVIDARAGSQRIRGPLSGRVLTSGLDGEKVVRTFTPAELDALDVAANTAARTTVVWNARDDANVALGADTYSLALDFIVGERPTRIGSVIQLVRP